MSTPAVAALRRAGVEHVVHRYDHVRGAAYGIEAAEALGVEAARVHKTLVVDTGDGLAVCVVAVTGELDLKSAATALGTKSVAMAEIAEAERTTGYVQGGISPVGQRKRLPTVIDDGALAWETVFVSGGRRGLEIELAGADLVAVTAASTATIGRPR